MIAVPSAAALLVAVPVAAVLSGGAPRWSGDAVRSPAASPIDGATSTARLPPRGVPPLTPLRVLHAYESVGRYAAGDRGVDLAGSPGQRVVSATTGTVTFAGSVAGRGVVSVTLADGRRLTNEPLAVAVHAGDRVAAGGALGTLSPGWPGCAAAACLHWGLATGHGATLAYADPMSVLGPRRVRLLPPDGPADSAADAAGAARTTGGPSG